MAPQINNLGAMCYPHFHTETNSNDPTLLGGTFISTFTGTKTHWAQGDALNVIYYRNSPGNTDHRPPYNYFFDSRLPRSSRIFILTRERVC